MSNNLLSGGLTNGWMYWKALVIIRLGDNNLSGTIPPSISFLANLKILHLNNNNLFGEIPLSLKYCQNLQIFDVGGNKFSGSIPKWIGHNAKILQFRSNQISGNIPPEICQSESLIILDLAYNKISGEIPRSLAQLSFLGTLNLSFNNFSRMIPLGTQLQGFDELSYIGNPELCGAPLPKNCSDKKDVKPIEENDTDQEDEFLASFYIASGVGFFVAFWGVCIAIFCISSFRNSYFRFLFSIRDKLYVMVALTMNRFG
ncbi:receptor-like protein EIX2 isoform X3 [Prosopis cineraria]|uniref:receptor-like protein EIX2 isoform X3 n=1 Tax=Prosopis cineraria TaxID=364024 RepID=UPI00240FC497|nr:receptor-like protein EIX2 isoform X3 [Prosopis cineraria]